MFRHILILVFTLLSLFTLTSPAQETMPLTEVKKGMKGVVRTTFEGTEIVEIDAEVLGVMPNIVGAKLDLIIVKLSGERIEHQGVASGMSGSPLYIEGRLAGALSYRLAEFPKDPLAGVTPIEHMLEAQKGGHGTPQTALDYHRLFAGSAIADTVAAALGKPAFSVDNAHNENSASPPAVMPLNQRISHAGIDPRTLSAYSSLFGENPMQISSSGAAGLGNQERIRLQPGSVMAASLIHGDLMYGATGTVTHVDGDKIWAFGHPFNQYGTVNYFLHSAEMVTVLTSIAGSSNLAKTGPPVGTIMEDRSAAIYGKTGVETPSLPLSITVLFEGEKIDTYEFSLVQVSDFIPGMMALCITNSIYTSQATLGDMSASIEGMFKLKNLPDVTFNNFFSSTYIPVEVGIFPSSLAYFLLNNDYEQVEFESAEITVDMLPRLRTASLEKAWVTKRKIKPGESFELVVEYKPMLERARQHTESFYIPETVQPGSYQIVIGNGSAIISHEQSMVQGDTQNVSIEQIIRMMNKLRTNDKIYAQTMRSEEGMYYNGTFFPSLPATKSSVAATNAQNAPVATLKGSVLDERNVRTGYVLQGTRTISFEVIE